MVSAAPLQYFKQPLHRTLGDEINRCLSTPYYLLIFLLHAFSMESVKIIRIMWEDLENLVANFYREKRMINLWNNFNLYNHIIVEVEKNQIFNKF